MTAAEKNTINSTLFSQVETNKQRKQDEIRQKSMEDRMILDQNSQLLERVRRVEAHRLEQAKRDANFLQEQMEEKRKRDNDLKNLYANKIAGEFFSQFGTSHR